jgi:hypothetical protein
MNIMDEFRKDVASFADDESTVEILQDGTMTFERLGVERIAQVRRTTTGPLSVQIDGNTYSHRRFLADYLSNLSTMADRLIDKREHVKEYIDSPANLQSFSLDSRSGKTMDLLDHICKSPSPFSTRLAFVTADAGQGKTVALQEYQRKTAVSYSKGESDFLFWHVDLQGRQLVRLNEALMGDLGDLRMTGIYMPSIIRLIKHGLIVLAIDGFDELAVEQGSVDALGALSALVAKLDGEGTIIAASRRTFFDTDDYVKRSRIISRGDTPACEIDQLQILPWTDKENSSYLKRVAPNGINGYGNEAETLQVFRDAVGGTNDHPLLTRPFLFTFAVKSAMKGLDKSAVLGIQAGTSPDAMESVKKFVDALIERDVMHKWRSKEGKPYLTCEQHKVLLAEVAYEMWSQQRDRIRVDTLEQITSSLLDLWDTSSPRQVVSSVKMHALLPPSYGGNSDYRKFDHPEFQNYFLAVAFMEHAKDAIAKQSYMPLSRFLSIAQMPESVGRYSCMILRESDSDSDVESLIKLLEEAVRNERRPTFLQLNVGAITPYLMHGIIPLNNTIFDANVPFSKLAFEGTTLQKRAFRHGILTSSSLQRTNWKTVEFRECVFTECTFDIESTYADVRFVDCDLQSIAVFENGEEIQREYVPSRIRSLLLRVGIEVVETEAKFTVAEDHSLQSEGRTLLQKFLRIFRRTTFAFEDGIDTKFGNEATIVKDQLIPILEEFGILVEKKHTSGGKKMRKWQLERSFEQVLQSEGGNNRLPGFWQRIDAI